MVIDYSTISHFFIQIGCAYAALIAIQEFVGNKPGRRLTPIFFLAVIGVSIQLRIGLHAVGLLEEMPYLAIGLIPSTFFFAPLALIIGRRVTDTQLHGYPVRFHFIIPTAVLTLDLFFYILFPAEAIAHVRDNVSGASISWPLWGMLSAVLFNLIYFTYFYLFAVRFKKKYNINTSDAGRLMKVAYIVLLLGTIAAVIAVPAVFTSMKIFVHICGLTLTAISIVLSVARSLYPDLLDTLFNYIQKQKYNSTSMSGVDVATVVNQIKGLITNEKLHTKSDLRMQDLANRLGISVHQTSRIINEQFEKPFSELINFYRIEDAKELLVATDKTVIEILFEVGFSSKSNFNAQFSKFVGMTPSNFRR